MTARSGGLEQLIYVSVANGPVGSAMQMSDILAEARPNNARDGISGVLTAVNGRFLQIVEGRPAALDDLLARLGEDDRHRDMQVMERRQVSGRTFAGWDMVSPRLMPAETNRLAVLLDEDRRDIEAYAPVFADALSRQASLLSEDLNGDHSDAAPASGRYTGC